MGVLIRCNDANFSNYVGIADFPIITALKGLYYFGGTADASKKDHSGNGNDGTFVGSETINTKSVTFAGTGTANYLSIPTGTSGVTSVYAVALVKKTGKRAILSAISSSGYGGFAFGTERILYKDGSGWIDLPLTLADANGFYPLAWGLTTSGCAMYCLNSAGLLVTVGSKSGGTLNSNTLPRMIGGTNFNWAMDGSADIAVVGAYEGSVTENQLIDALKFLRVYGEANGLTVI